ncbi:MAG: DKNYY domain-containing protein [Taibaiella sp.]|nr:DKNYY domain-containing protein [Taibaiella sp.]
MKQLIIILFTILILTSCRHGYKVEGDKVYYEYWNEGSGQNKRIIELADAKTFQKLSLDCDCNFEFGMDKNHLFMDGELIKNIEPNTFEFIGNYIFRDKDAAYFFGFYNNLNDCAIKGVNPDKIELIKYPWAKSGNLLIHGKDTVFLDDIRDFVPLDDNWGKTKKYIINKNQIIYGADVTSFKIINSFQGKDRNYSFKYGKMSENDFREVSYKTFDFDQDFCTIKPTVFADIYDSLVYYNTDENERIEIVERLKSDGFIINNIRHSNIAGDSKIIRIFMTNNNCNCTVEKLYNIDYSRPSGTEDKFEVVERIYCSPKH